MGKLHDLIDAKFGVRTTVKINRTISSVGTTATECLVRDPNRLAFLVINLSTNAMYLLPGKGVSSSKGIRLDVSGGSYAGLWDEEFDLVGYSWEIVAAGTSSALLTLEILSY